MGTLFLIRVVYIHLITVKTCVDSYAAHARRQREMIEQLDLDVVRYDKEASVANQK